VTPFSASRWAEQTMIWTERQRGRPLYWPAGASWFANDPLGPHPHTHPDASEIYFVETGTLALTVGRQELVMRAGDFCLIPPNTFHDPRNGGDDDLGLFVIVAPNWRDRRWKIDGFEDADFDGTASVARTEAVGPLPSDLEIGAEVVGAGSGPESASSPHERVLYVLAGQLDLALDHLSGRLGPGEYVHVPAGASSTVSQAGSSPVRLLSISTPGRTP
jgi:mannose-6-phosphate isomerase-like protein (cupin superfamily)